MNRQKDRLADDEEVTPMCYPARFMGFFLPKHLYVRLSTGFGENRKKT